MKNIGFEKIKEKIHLSSEAKGALYELALFALGFWFMSVRFLFGTYPFAIALIGASKKQMPFILVGAALSSVLLMESSALYVISLIFLGGLRVASSFIKKSDFKRTELGQSQGKKIKEMLFCEGVEFRVAVASLVAMGIGIFNVVSKGYVYYDIFALVFFTVFVSIMTYCFSGLFEAGEGKERLIGGCALLFALAYALGEKEIGGISIVLVLSCGAVLYVSKYFGGIKGSVLGIVLGIGQGGILCGVLGLFGLISGFLWAISPYLSIMFSFVLSMGYAISIMGYDAIIYYIPELLTASLIMYPLLRFELLPIVQTKIKSEGGGTMELYHLENRQQDLKEKMSKLSVAYGDVAKILKDVSKKTKNPDKRGYYDMALEVCESYCYSCPKENICWRRDVNTTQANIDSMGQALYVRKLVDKKDVGEKFLHRCPNIDKIMDELNEKTKKIFTQGIKNDKLEVSAQDYDYTSKMINSIFQREKNVSYDKQLTEKAIRVGAMCGLICEKIEVMKDEKTVIIATGVDVQRSKCTSLELKREMEKGLGIALKDAEVKENDGYTVIRLENENCYKVDIYAQSRKNEMEEVNGDSYISFESDSKQYVILCDGMGSGQDAQLTSSMCTEFLEKMLKVSCEKELILSMLNSFIRSKNTECSSSVDLLEMDLIDGTGKFIKSGAGPSFVKRGDKVFKLQSKTAPVGIMKSLDAEELTFTLAKGDICVMVSDGVAISQRDNKWIMQYISDFKEENINSLVKGILEEAKRLGSKDDMTAIVSVIN